MAPLFIHGRLHAGHFIFLKSAQPFIDTDLLERFGLVGYAPKDAVPDRGRYAILGRHGPWTLLADDWYYTVWHMPTTRATLEELARQHDVYAFWVGECDDSFGFHYFQDGKLIRRFVVDDPKFDGGFVKESIGRSLPGEMIWAPHKSGFRICEEIASSLGISVEEKHLSTQIYAPEATHLKNVIGFV